MICSVIDLIFLSIIIGDVANSKHPVDYPKSATALAHYPQKCNCACALPAEVGKSFLWGKKFSDCADAVAFIQ